MRENNWRIRFAKRGLTSVGFLLLAMFVVAACGGEAAGDLAVGDKAPAFSLRSSAGETIQLDDYIGNQPVLLYFHMAVG